MTESNRLYITLNRESEWQRCLLSGLKVQGNVITALPRDDISGTAVMITGSIDSCEHNFAWSNLLLDLSCGDNTIIKVSAYAADTTVASVEGRVFELDSVLADAATPPEERLKLLDGLFRPLFTNCTDGLVNLRGRYIWIKLEFIMLESTEIEIRKIKLLLRGERIMNYLPEIYAVEDGENGFLSRYLSIFDSIFFEMDNAIENLSRSLDYRIAKGKLLQYLSEWICVEDSAYLDDEELRKRMRAAITDYRTIGVKRGLIKWIENEYGVTPNIIEYFDVKKSVHEGKDREVYKRLFGDDPYKFFIILPENVFADTHESNIFMEKLKKNIPAYTEAEVIISKDSIILEDHTYLGVNTVINRYSTANIDAGTSISHDIILGGSPNEQQ
ncbi:MAG: hypothetical protein ACI4KM_05265 [Oscillospiraceae bacterium]